LKRSTTSTRVPVGSPRRSVSVLGLAALLPVLLSLRAGAAETRSTDEVFQARIEKLSTVDWETLETSWGEDPSLLELHQHLADGRWSTFERILETLRVSRRMSEDGVRLFEMRIQDLSSGHEEFLDRWVDASPGSYLPWLVRARHHFRAAW